MRSLVIRIAIKVAALGSSRFGYSYPGNRGAALLIPRLQSSARKEGAFQQARTLTQARQPGPRRSRWHLAGRGLPAPGRPSRWLRLGPGHAGGGRGAWEIGACAQSGQPARVPEGPGTHVGRGGCSAFPPDWRGIIGRSAGGPPGAAPARRPEHCGTWGGSGSLRQWPARVYVPVHT